MKISVVFKSHADPLPHEGGCEGCRTARQCNVCGAAITQSSRCTNGRCLRCHGVHCSSGGDVSAGHNYWASREAREEAMRPR